jgi:hypothetical protein
MPESKTEAYKVRASKIPAPKVRATKIRRALIENWRTLASRLSDPYRPELHYMRGPGPKWREKHGQREPEELGLGAMTEATV